MNDTRTATQREKDRNYPAPFFWAVRIFFATTSYAAGNDYLAQLYWLSIGRYIGNNQQLGENLFPVLGGLTALLLTTGAYLYWLNIRRRSTETEVQSRAAWWGEHIALVSDLLFTCITFANLYYVRTDERGVEYLPPVVADNLRFIAIVAFFTLTITHFLLVHVFDTNSVESMTQTMKAKHNGQRESERLKYEDNVKTIGLKQASNMANSHSKEYADRLANLWKQELVSRLPSGDSTPRPTRKQTKSPRKLLSTHDHKPIIVPSQQQITDLNGSNGHYPNGNGRHAP